MALFSTVEQIREYVAVNAASSIEDLLPYINQAEMKFIKPVIGKELYDELKAFAEGSSTDGDYEELLKMVCLPLAHYALYLAVPILNVQVSSSGIHIATTNEKKTAFEWQVDQLRDSFLNTAHDFIEPLLEFLEENTTTFTSWSGSNNRTEAFSLFINTATEFNEHYFINGSRRLFTALRPIMKSVEQKYIKSTIGEGLFDAIKTEIQASEGPDSDIQTLLDIINPCVAHFTMHRALSELSLEIIPNAIFENVVQVVSKAKQSASKDKIAILKDELLLDARAELKQLQEYLDANATAQKYAEYFNSSLYVAPVDGTRRGEFVNSKDKGFYLA